LAARKAAYYGGQSKNTDQGVHQVPTAGFFGLFFILRFRQSFTPLKTQLDLIYLNIIRQKTESTYIKFLQMAGHKMSGRDFPHIRRLSGTYRLGLRTTRMKTAAFRGIHRIGNLPFQANLTYNLRIGHWHGFQESSGVRMGRFQIKLVP